MRAQGTVGPLWRHQVNTIERSVRDGDAASCQTMLLYRVALCVLLCSEDASGEGLSLDDIDGMLKGLSAELEQMLSRHSSS